MQAPKPMRSTYDLFEANQLHRTTRSQMCRLNAAFWGVVVVTIGAAMMSPTLFASAPMVVGSGLGVLVMTAVGISVKHYLLSRTIWCVRVGPDAVISYDCVRRKTVWSWDAARQVDLTDDRLSVIQSPYRVLSLATEFDTFPALSHRIVQDAERHNVPFTIDGQSLDAIDVYALCPFLAGEHPPAAPPGTSS